jgi:hypothetical protein
MVSGKPVSLLPSTRVKSALSITTQTMPSSTPTTVPSPVLTIFLAINRKHAVSAAGYPSGDDREDHQPHSRDGS